MLHHTDYLYNLRHDLYTKMQSVVIFAAAVILVLWVVLRFLTMPIAVGSVAMQQELKPGDRVFVIPLTAARTVPFALSAAGRGDIVLVKPRGESRSTPLLDRLDAVVTFFTFRTYSFVNPASLVSLSPTLSRVAALPGDTVYMRDHILYVRPPDAAFFVTEFELSDSRYNTTTRPDPSLWPADVGVPGNFTEITLGADEYYLLSDDRSSAFDSRIWGPLPASAIVGKVWFRYFPLGNIRLY